MRDLRNEKFEKMRKAAEEKQLNKIRNHPSVPDDFDWRTYIFLNPDVTTAKNIDTEFLAVRHWIKMGRKWGLKYNVKDISPEEMTVYLPGKMEELVQEKRKDTSDKPKGRRVIYTCISGNYDPLKEIQDYDEEWDYICFTDSPKIGYSEHWEIREIPKILERLDSTRRARALKVLPQLFLPNYDEYIWLDGSTEILKSPGKFVDRFINKEDVFVTLKHPDRVCVYQEKDACIKYGKDNPSVLTNQALEYERDGYPKNWGMIQSMIIYRKNTPEVEKLCNLWWEQILKHSKRDQMAFNYVLWKYPIPVRLLNPSVVCSEYFWLWTHSDKEAKRARVRKDYDDLQNFINGKPA